jgi:hypothetical protein
MFRQQVIKRLGSEISSDRMFSFREQFADAWFDLNNADAIENVSDRMAVTFSTRAEDLPSHIGNLEIQEPNTPEVLRWFKDEEIQDLALVITFGGTAPEWTTT